LPPRFDGGGLPPRFDGGGAFGDLANWMSALDEAGCAPGVNLIESDCEAALCTKASSPFVPAGTNGLARRYLALI
jgi:hypothetical protein